MARTDDALRALAALHGVQADYTDLQGARHEASPDTLRALLAGLGVEAGSPGAVQAALTDHAATRAARRLAREYILIEETPLRIALPEPADWVLQQETGSVMAEGRAEGEVPLPGLPAGYYSLTARGRGWEDRALILCRPAVPADLPAATGLSRCWGTSAALYGLRSAGNGGLGNYADLRQAAVALAGHGAQFLGLNPIHALGWARTEIISPYSPSHRGFFNTDHIALDAGLGPSPADALIDYPAFRARHRPALEAAWDAVRQGAGLPDFEAWRAAAAPDLQAFAEFEALSEIHGADARRWPARLRRPGPESLKAAGPRADFHAWLQWQAARQTHAAQAAACEAGMALGLYLDLAVGPRPDGAEVWMNADTIARGVTIGAPPDHLSPEGQSWALAAYSPRALAAADYRPLRAVLGRLMATCGLLRIDHALGLMRSFWIPDDGSPGGYVSQPLDSLLAVIAIEAARHGCLVVGEDLGLVPPGFRDKLVEAGFYRYAVWQFETGEDGRLDPVATMPPHSLACFGTHDTPTLRGFWYGRDIETWHQVGWLKGQDRAEKHASRARQRQGLRAQCGIADTASAGEVADAVHRALLSGPAALVSVQLDDALGVLEAQNLPGTIDEHPNWRRRLPVPVEDFATSPALARIAALVPPARRAEPGRARPTERGRQA